MPERVGRSSAKTKFQRAKNLFEEDLWRLDLDSLPRLQGHFYRSLRGVYLVAKGFIDHRCLLLASALTYTTLLSLVPLLALMFSIAKGLGVQNRLEPILLEKLSVGSGEVASHIIGYIDRTNVTTLGALGLVGLIATAISVIGSVEMAFNRIWGVERTRSLERKFSDYLSVLLTCPLLIVGALGVTSSVQSAAFVRVLLQFPGMSTLVFFLAFLSPYILMWIALTFVYFYLPNTTVPLRSAFFGGIVGGTLWQLAQWAYVHFQVGVAKYNAIYGAFAQLPIFLVWVYLSWAVVLLGAVISAVHQNIEAYRREVGEVGVNYSFMEELGLKVLWLIGKNFYSEIEPWTADGLSRKLDVPLRLANQILHQYYEAGILMPASREEKEICLLAKPPENLHIDQIIETMRSHGGKEMKIKEVEGEEALKGILQRLAESRRSALGQVTLRDLVLSDTLP